jgi:monoterpene epsilon-lactone hydrolase
VEITSRPPSLASRGATLLTKIIFRRHHWGDEDALARRARLLVGAPKLYGRWRTMGLEVRKNDDPRGEWIIPPLVRPGIIFYLHGGGYISGSPPRYRPITSGLARRTGRRVFALDYRLGPEHKFPAALDDARSAYRWLLSEAAEGETIALAGDSAGGGLSLALLLACRDEGLPMPSSVALFSPWTDLAGTGESLRTNNGKCAMFYPENIAQFASAYLGSADPRDLRASPLLADLRGLPPMLIQVGSTELLLDDSRRLYSAIMDAGGQAELEVYREAMHCWQMFDGLVPEAGEALDHAAEFLIIHVSATSDSAASMRN